MEAVSGVIQMTKSTGVRERQRRREELLSGEMKLRRVLLHLMNAIDWARRSGHEREYVARDAAFGIVRDCYRQIEAEQRAL